MNRLIKELVTNEDGKQYKFKLGTVVASSLAGFIAGAVVSSLLWILAIALEII